MLHKRSAPRNYNKECGMKRGWVTNSRNMTERNPKLDCRKTAGTTSNTEERKWPLDTVVAFKKAYLLHHASSQIFPHSWIVTFCYSMKSNVDKLQLQYNQLECGHLEWLVVWWPQWKLHKISIHHKLQFTVPRFYCGEWLIFWLEVIINTGWASSQYSGRSGTLRQRNVLTNIWYAHMTYSQSRHP